MCKVSIILPTYNRKYCLADAVDSILQQTYQDYELIIVDDASTDGTEEWVRSLLETYSFIRYVRLTQNAGAAAARNAGIREAVGEYIAFQDSDTKWTETKLEKQVKYIESLDDSVGIVYSPYQKVGRNYLRIYPALDVPKEEKSGHILRSLLEHPLVDTPTMLARKDVLKEIGGFDENMRALEDYELSIRIAKSYQICILDEVLLVSYDSTDSISNDIKRYIQNSFYLLKKHKELFAQYDMTMTYLNQLSQYALQCHQLEVYVQYLQELLGKKTDRKVLFVNGGAMRTASAPIVMAELSRLDFEVEEYEQLLELTELDDDKVGDLADYIREHHVDVIISLFFIMDAALAAYQTNVPYAAILWDAPYMLAYNVLAKLDNVWFSTFDKLDRDRLLQYGCQHVLYQPLSVSGENVIQWNRDIQNTLEGHYFHDISFVGRLYEDNGYDAVVDQIPANMQNYFTSIFEEAAFKWDGVNRIYGRTGQEILEYIKLVSPNFYITDTKQDIEEVRYFEVQYLIRKIANIERVTILDFLAENYTVDLYTFDEEAAKGLLHNVNVRPAAIYGKAAALVFAGSKINLHIALKGIEGGTSQRVMDICAAGGFVLSSYCAETAELFEEDKEIVMFKTPEELLEKIDYYLSHEEERRQIAKAGYEKVMRCYTYEKKLRELIDWVQGENIR